MAQDFDLILAQQKRRRQRQLLVFAIVALVVLVSWGYVDLYNLSRLSEGIPSLFRLVAEMLPPDFSQSQSWLRPLVDTLAMSIAGTTIAVLLAIPLGVLAARNCSPHPVVYHITRGFLNFLRAIPELIKGIIFVAAVGFGALPGVLALSLHSVGMVAKFFAEAIEHADPAPIEAARASGATPLQVIYHGVFPQVLPQLADTAMYRWEYNFRASTVMGMVGAGGIGFELMGSLRIMQYQEVSAILIIILIMVTLVDRLSGWLRTQLN